jgi:Holliday junction resolvase
MGAIYEREFKGILSGDEKVLEAVGKSLSAPEREAYRRTLSEPFLVVRAAGSLGADLVAVRSDLSFLIEVKSAKPGAIYFTAAERLVEQIEVIRHQCERAGVLPVYAFRKKGVRGDAWRLFTMPEMTLTSNAGLVWRRLPHVGKTAQGNDVLRWEEGMPMAEFLRLVCRPNLAPVAAKAALAAPS